MHESTRREFLKKTAGMAVAVGAVPAGLAVAQEKPGARMQFGLVTYLWAQNWDLPTIIANCEASKVLGVELRTQHKHGVEPNISAAERAEVKKRFADSAVTLVGLGSNENFDSPDPEKLKQSIEAAKGYIVLSHDVGASGVKVKPNDFHEGVPKEKTFEQIAASLNTIGAFAADYGQEIRLEVHGKCSPLPIMKQIIDQVTAPNVGLCWNSNGQDLEGEGLEYNFNLVKNRFGHTAHVREMNLTDYPYQQLMDLFVGIDYEGWVLLEAREEPKEPVKALIEQREVFEKMIGRA